MEVKKDREKEVTKEKKINKREVARMQNERESRRKKEIETPEPHENKQT